MPDMEKELREALAPLTEEIPPMPEGLHERWMQQVEADAAQANPRKKTTVYRTVTRYLSLAAALVFIVGGTLLTRDDLMLHQENGSSLTSSGQRASGASFSLAYANDYDLAAADSTVYGTMTLGASADSGNVKMLRSTESAEEETAAIEKKIIRTASMTIATQTYVESLARLKSTCEELGGWLESSSESVNSSTNLRTAYLTLRIPQTGLDGYLLGATELGRITRRSETATDVTESYQDTQARLNTQLALMARLQALITESADLSDLLALESQIADTQYQIDRLQSSLNSTDRQVTYSMVDITLREETEVELTDSTVTLGERLRSAIRIGWEALVGFCADTAVFLVAAAPFIGIVLIVCIALFIIKKVRKKS